MTTPTTPEALDEGPNHAAWEQFGAVMESLAETMDDGPMVTNEAGVEFLDALARRGYEVRPHTTPALRDAIAQWFVSSRSLTTMTDTWAADWSVSPGEVLAETLDERGMTQSELGKRMARPLKTISEIANGKAAITPETAIQLERALGISASVWLGLESNYRESLARGRDREELEAHVSWLKRFPVRTLIERRIIDDAATVIPPDEREPEGRQDGIVKRQWTLQYERLLKPREEGSR